MSKWQDMLAARVGPAMAAVLTGRLASAVLGALVTAGVLSPEVGAALDALRLALFGS